MASRAIDYLTIYLKYHINMHSHQNLIFMKNQLRIIISEKFPDLDGMIIDKVIHVTLQFVSAQSKISKFVTDEAIYLRIGGMV